VSEHVLQTIGELESVDVSQSELNVDVDDELGETEDLSAEMDWGRKGRVASVSVSKRRRRARKDRRGE